jgi:hypothetical protein
MERCEKIEAAALAVIEAFENPTELPEPMAQTFFRPRDDVPCRRWSRRNQAIIALRGTTDARTFRQWRAVGRHVRAGEKAFHISAPFARRRVVEGGAARDKAIGFRGVPVFAFHQTEGDPLPASNHDEGKWIESLPLVDVARQWELNVRMFDAGLTPFLGMYCRLEKVIMIGVENIATWAHELIHAADDRLGGLTGLGCHWTHEVVADLGAAVLLRLLGFEVESDLGGSRRSIRFLVFREDLTVAEACRRVLTRTCAAVEMILNAAEAIRRQEASV